MRYLQELNVAVQALNDACQQYLAFNSNDNSRSADKLLIANPNFDIEGYIARTIKQKFDGDMIVSELYNSKQFVAHRTWTIEHIGKISLLSEGIKSFGIQISLAEAKDIVLSVIYIPYYDELYHAILGGGAYLNNKPIHTEIRNSLNSTVCFGDFDLDNKKNSDMQVEMIKNLRRRVKNIYLFGSTSINFAYLASGKVDGVVLFSRNLCDINPGLLLCQEAGCMISNINGKAYTYEDNSILIASSSQMLATLTNSTIERDDTHDDIVTIKVGFYGVQGCESEEMAHKMVESLSLKNVEYIPCVNCKEVATMIAYGRLNYGVLPIRDEDGQTYRDSNDAIASAPIEMACVDKMNVTYCIFKKHKDINSGDLKKVATQAFVFSKVDKVLHVLMANAVRLEIEDSTIAAKMLHDGKLDDTTAVICTKEAGLSYRLTLVKDNINNDTEQQCSIEFRMFKPMEKSTKGY